MFLLLKLWTEGTAYHRGQKSMKSATEAFQGLTAKTMNRFVTLCALTRLQHLTPSQHRPPPPGHDRKHAAAVWQGRHSRSSENLHSGREAVWHLRKYRAQGGRRLYDRQLCHHRVVRQVRPADRCDCISTFGSSHSVQRAAPVSHPL